MLPLAGYLCAEPGGYRYAFFLGYICIVLIGGIEIAARLYRPRPEPNSSAAASDAREIRNLTDHSRKLALIIAALAEPVNMQPLGASRTLH